VAANFKGSSYQKYLLDIMALYKQRDDVKAYLELLLSLFAIGLFIIFAIKPTLVTIGDLFTKINVLQDTSDKLDTKIKNLGTAQTLFNNNKDTIKLLDTSVPVNPNLSGYIRQLEGISQKHNLTVISMSVGELDLIAASTSATPKAMATTISVSGSYTDLENFIKDVENLRQPAILSKVDFTNQSSILNLTITPQAPYVQ
jgi:Tfp pilus assembly protein PilO